MCKSRFTVSYLSPSNPEICVLGVTSIVPNLNGLLLFTEDGEGFQIESYEMAMEMLDVDDAACAKYFTMMLDGTARTWLNSLPAHST